MSQPVFFGPRRSLWLALALSLGCAASAQSQDADTSGVRRSVERLQSQSQQDRDGVDPRYARSWLRFCSEDPERGACETMLKRIGLRPVIGVVLARDATRGVQIAGVTPDGPAAKAGLRRGDRLLSVDGKALDAQVADTRVEDARNALQNAGDKRPITLVYERDGKRDSVSLTPQRDARLMVFGQDGAMFSPEGRTVILRRIGDGGETVTEDVYGLAPPAGGGREVQRIVRRVGPDGEVKVDDEDVEILIERTLANAQHARPGQMQFVEAFRWNGLNLASVDAKLGRYFGTDSGVLVLSAGPNLGTLEAGDVIRRIEGAPVNTPREAMAALRGKPEGSSVRVEYLRDRKSASATLKVPQADFPMPPTPPAPPAPRAPSTPQAAPTPPPGAPRVAMQTEIITVDAQGNVEHRIEHGNAPPTPPTPPAAPTPPPPPQPPARVD
jgi:hypothetical protein